MLTTAIIAIALTTVVAVVRLLVRANTGSEATVVSAHLSLRLLDEVRLRRWDERTPTPSAYTRRRSAIGADAGEAAGDKREFDDVDDFDGWSEAPPLDPVMTPLEGMGAYASSVTVRYVDGANLSPTGSRTDLKQVSVCSWRKGRRPVCLDTLVSNR